MQFEKTMPKTKDTKTARETYHHGNLVEALVAAAIAIVEEKGVDNLSVREVAKKAGVSPGAPFRHFSSKGALLTAVAEQAIHRLAGSVEQALSTLAADDPMEQLRAVGMGYLDWARLNPTHFQIISSRTLIDFHGSETLVSVNEALRLLLGDIIRRARDEGRMKASLDTDDVMLSARAFVYGLARMYIDGHFSEWKVSRPPDDAMRQALDLFIEGLRAAPPDARR